MLRVKGLHAGYGRLNVLRSVDMEIPDGSTVGIFGRNGAGKSTLAKAIMRLVNITSGSVHWNDLALHKLRTDQIVKRGVSLVPQSRGLFASQTVTENLRVACYSSGLRSRETHQRLEEVFQRFPAIAERRSSLASSLSGGEAQMLAIAKSLVRRPHLLILDEPSIGLAPTVVNKLADVVAELKRQKLTVIVTEQNIPWILGLVDSAFILDQGAITETMDADAVRGLDASRMLAHYLGGSFANA